jgi:hypothetical protein
MRRPSGRLPRSLRQPRVFSAIASWWAPPTGRTGGLDAPEPTAVAARLRPGLPFRPVRITRRSGARSELPGRRSRGEDHRLPRAGSRWCTADGQSAGSSTAAAHSAPSAPSPRRTNFGRKSPIFPNYRYCPSRKARRTAAAILSALHVRVFCATQHREQSSVCTSRPRREVGDGYLHQPWSSSCYTRWPLTPETSRPGGDER